MLVLVCDGVVNCLLHGDDKAMCNDDTCPPNCKCHNDILFCDKFSEESLPQLPRNAGVTMTLFCTHGRVSGPSSLLDLEVMAPRGYSVPCQF